MKLAVYGTLRAGSNKTGVIKNSSLVYPGHESFPAVIHNKKGSGTVVEVHDVSEEDLVRYDMYEGVSSGLYRRVKTKVNMDVKHSIKRLSCFWSTVFTRRFYEIISSSISL